MKSDVNEPTDDHKIIIGILWLVEWTLRYNQRHIVPLSWTESGLSRRMQVKSCICGIRKYWLHEEPFKICFRYFKHFRKLLQNTKCMHLQDSSRFQITHSIFFPFTPCPHLCYISTLNLGGWKIWYLSQCLVEIHKKRLPIISQTFTQAFSIWCLQMCWISTLNVPKQRGLATTQQEVNKVLISQHQHP